MKNLHQYDNMEELNKCKKEAEIEIEKLYNRLGFIVLDVAAEIRLRGKSPAERRKYYARHCRGGSSY